MPNKRIPVKAEGTNLAWHPEKVPSKADFFSNRKGVAGQDYPASWGPSLPDRAKAGVKKVKDKLTKPKPKAKAKPKPVAKKKPVTKKKTVPKKKLAAKKPQKKRAY
jgi:hypothetical protein